MRITQEDIQGLLNKDQKAQDIVFKKIHNYVMHLCNQKEEVVLEVIRKAFMNVKDYGTYTKSTGSFVNFLKLLSRNEIINHYKANLKYNDSIHLTDEFRDRDLYEDERTIYREDDHIKLNYFILRKS